MTSNGMMIVNNEKERMCKKLSWPNLKHHLGIYMAGLRKTTIHLSQQLFHDFLRPRLYDGIIKNRKGFGRTQS
jgi:hypothetical protein